MARAPRLGGPWGKFWQLRVDGFRPAKDANVYFASVSENPADPGSLVGLFPVQSPAGAMVAIAVSRDGLRWSEFARRGANSSARVHHARAARRLSARVLCSARVQTPGPRCRW